LGHGSTRCPRNRRTLFPTSGFQPLYVYLSSAQCPLTEVLPVTGVYIQHLCLIGLFFLAQDAQGNLPHCVASHMLNPVQNDKAPTHKAFACLPSSRLLSLSTTSFIPLSTVCARFLFDLSGCSPHVKLSPSTCRCPLQHTTSQKSLRKTSRCSCGSACLLHVSSQLVSVCKGAEDIQS